MSKRSGQPPRRNPVAKFVHQVNKPKVFRDRTRYRRVAKHKGREPFSLPAVCGR